MSGRFATTIDGVEHQLNDPLVKGRDLLEIAGRIPVDEHLLFYRQPDGLLEDINLAEEIDLRASGKEEFSSVKADRLFFLVVDGRRFPWGKRSEECLVGKEWCSTCSSRWLPYN